MGRKGIEQRDSAVRAGASGAVTLIFKHRRLFMPPLDETEPKELPEIAKQLLDLFQPGKLLKTTKAYCKFCGAQVF